MSSISRWARPRRRICAAALATLLLVLAGCGSSQPRTQVLRSANPLTSDIYVRITGPGGAVSYVARRFTNGGGFRRFGFHEPRGRGLFLPPAIRERRLCSSAHVGRPGDASQLQKWRGRKVAITVYGRRISTIFCAALTPDLYLGAS
ncbi:MAG TPA: hypothetical protein VE984_06190 [Gaiellaceae bacterium]|nr:hypothetical protein [Gaiellaceae bacterium]